LPPFTPRASFEPWYGAMCTPLLSCCRRYGCACGAGSAMVLFVHFDSAVYGVPQPPFERRLEFHEGPPETRRAYSMILDTMFVKSYAPPVASKVAFQQRWKLWWSGDPRKSGYGIKVEVAVSVSNSPKLVWFNVAPASTPDGYIGKLPGGLFSRMLPNERVITDGAPTYTGSVHCRAPPHRGQLDYVADLDKAELTVQRGVERCIHLLRAWRILHDQFRMSPAERGYYEKISAAAAVCCKLLALDQQLNKRY
jgi:hypothetical protein